MNRVPLTRRSVRELIRVASALALIALAAMSYSVISLRPLPVIFAMSVGHAIGISAFACYLFAILLDLRGAGTREAAEPESVEEDVTP